MYQGHQTQSKSALIPPQALAEWGVGEYAYIKLEKIDGKRLFVVHAADGESLVAADSYSLAAAMVIQNDLMPVSAH